MSCPPETLIVCKTDSSRHATVVIDESALPPLAPSSVRIRPVVLSIGINMMFFVRRTPYVDWFPAFPLPPTAAAAVPSGSVDDWCVSKTWGYAQVVDSTISNLPVGIVLQGWVPVSSAQHDLALKPFDLPGSKGHYLETSPERSALFKLANHYFIAAEQPTPDAWKAAVIVTWGSSHLLSRFCFPADNKADSSLAPAHPLGKHGSGPWNTADADLTASVVVALSASSKAGRSLTYHFTTPAQRGDNKPLAYLRVSSSPARKGVEDEGLPAQYGKKVDYASLASRDTLDWIASFHPSRILLVDLGARDPATFPDLFEKASSFFSSSSSPSSLRKVTLFMLATPPAVATDPDLGSSLAAADIAFERVQFNHSYVQDYGEEHLGAEDVRREWDVAFEDWTARGAQRDLRLVEDRGGVRAAERAFARLAPGDDSDEKPVPSDEAWAFWM